MNKLFCSTCNEFKDDFRYANPFNSTKFCKDCEAALDEKEFVEETEEIKTDWISETIVNAIMKM